MKRPEPLKPHLTIVTDDREQSFVIHGTLVAMPDVAVHVRRLTLGDFRVGGHPVVERKTLGDFGVSVSGIGDDPARCIHMPVSESVVTYGNRLINYFEI